MPHTLHTNVRHYSAPKEHGRGSDDPSESNNLSASWLFWRTLIDVSVSVTSVIVFELAIAEVLLFSYSSSFKIVLFDIEEIEPHIITILIFIGLLSVITWHSLT